MTASADCLREDGCHVASFEQEFRKACASVRTPRPAEVEPELAVFECDESYFGGVRKGKRGRGAAGKVCVFGILKRGGRVYALPADATSQTLLTALKTRVKADSVV